MIFSTESGIEMQDECVMSAYDDSKPGEEKTMEINVDFKDIIALRICNQPYYKLITYTKNISELKHLKEHLKFSEFKHHSEKLTVKEFDN